MVDWLLERLREPSTYAGFSGLALAVGISADQFQAIAALIAAIAGVAAVFMKSKSAS